MKWSLLPFKKELLKLEVYIQQCKEQCECTVTAGWRTIKTLCTSVTLAKFIMLFYILWLYNYPLQLYSRWLVVCFSFFSFFKIKLFCDLYAFLFVTRYSLWNLVISVQYLQGRGGLTPASNQTPTQPLTHSTLLQG